MASQAQGQNGQKISGPPYPPQIWTLGGSPEVGVDIPITSVFLALFVIGAAAHMTIFQLNRKHGHKFLMSGLLFGFCMARIATSVLRIVSTRFSKDVPLAIAAQIFVSAGVVIIFIVNLLFTQRMLRAAHPHFGWHVFASWAFKVVYILIILTIIMVIVVTVQSFYTLSPNTHRIDRDIQLYGGTFFAIVSFLPIPLVILGLIVPRRHKLDKFGQGRWRTKVIILLTSSFLVCFGAAYRSGTSWLTPVPRTRPLPAYFHKAAFYIVNFTVEIIVVYMFAILRVDRRFHVPDGARGPGSYSGGDIDWKHKSVGQDSLEQSPELRSSHEDMANEEKMSQETPRFSLPRVYTEEETFDEDEFSEAAEADQRKNDLEQGTLVQGSRYPVPHSAEPRR